MNIKITLVIESDEGAIEFEQEVAQLKRDHLSSATLGLTLGESKRMLQTIQQEIVEAQVDDYIEQQTPAQIVVNLVNIKVDTR